MPKIEIHFDGGCKPNPGQKYGSFEVLLDGRSVHKITRLDLGHGTNNEAEYETLIEAVRWTYLNLLSGGFHPDQFCVEVFTDSSIVRNGVMRPARRKNRSGRMIALAEKCLLIARHFKSFTARWNPRQKNVNRFGH